MRKSVLTIAAVLVTQAFQEPVEAMPLSSIGTSYERSSSLIERAAYPARPVRGHHRVGHHHRHGAGWSGHNRPGWHGGYRHWGRWSRPGGYWWRPGGAIAAGAAIGFVSAATAAAWAGAAPGPDLCWYYTTPARTQGFWDACH